jgi:hypothetical protein
MTPPSATPADTLPVPTVHPTFVVRTTGLPLQALTQLSSALLRAALHDAAAVRHRLTTEGRALADALEPVVADPPVPALKPQLAGLRRSLFRCRPPRPPEWSPAVRSALPTALADRIDRWTGLFGQLERTAADVARTLEAETGRTLHTLLATAADPSFRHGLVQSSPTLSAQWEKWLRHRNGLPPRRITARLARYVSRAAAKTSPNTTFATIGAGRFAPDHSRVPDGRTGIADSPPHSPQQTAAGPAGGAHTGSTDRPAVRATGTPAAPRGLLELHGPLFGELTAALTADPDLRAAMPVRVNPSLTRLGDRITVIGRPPAEEITSVAALPEVTACLAVLAHGPHTLAALRSRLRGTANGTARQEKITSFTDRLIDLGLLQPHLPVDDRLRDKFGPLGDWLNEHGGPARAGLADACRQLAALLHEPTDLTAVEAHHDRLRRIRAAVTAVRTHAGLPQDPAGTSALTHEYALVPAPAATACRPAWQPALADLDRIRTWMAVHDTSLPLRIALAAYWERRYHDSRPVPFTAFHRALLAEVKQVGNPTGAPGRTAPDLADLRAELAPRTTAPAWRLDALKELAALREQSLNAIHHTPPDPDGVIRLDPARLADLLPQPPAHLRPATSVAWFVQTDGRRLVLNSAMSGHGRGRLRPLYLIAQATDGEPAPPAGPAAERRTGLPVRFADEDGSPVLLAGTSGLLADTSGDFGHSLNLRLPRDGHELDYPFTVVGGDRPRVRLGDLAVDRDPDTGLLRLRDLAGGAVVTPVHPGMVVDSALPPALRMLTRGFGVNPSWLLRPADLLHPAPGPAACTFAPRVEAGLVVLRRATWTVPADRVPRRAPGETDAALLLRLHQWLATHRIPDRCFVRTNTPGGAHWTAPGSAKDRKPLYVDFTAPWLVELFHRLIRDATQEVAFCEVLPAFGQDETRPGEPFPGSAADATADFITADCITADITADTRAHAPVGGALGPRATRTGHLTELVIETTAVGP